VLISAGSYRPVVLLSTAAVVAGLVLPGLASAGPSRSGATASRVEERERRAEERAARARERHAERAEERAARRREHASRRNSARESVGEQPVPSGTAGEPGTPESGAPLAGAAGCRLSAEASAEQITAGEPVTVLGRLICPVGLDAAGHQLVVYEHQGGGGPSSFGMLGAALTEAGGSYRLTVPALDANTIFQVRDGKHRARAVVKVAPRVTLSAAPAAQVSAAGAHPRRARWNRVTFTGTVSPAVTGALVALQIAYPASGEQWHLVAFGRVGADGTYSVSHTFRTPGEVSVRAVAHVGRFNVPGASEALSYEVEQPQNPQLTIQTSAAPLTYGESATISGVVAGAKNQPVTLLARMHGTAFAPVANATTDENGNYSFTQAPLQDTYYEVTYATMSSTSLFEGVKLALAGEPPPNATQAGQPVTFSGTLTPAKEGQTVYLERQYASGIGFHVVGSATVGAAFTYTIVHTFDSAGTSVMRIRAPGDGRREGATSAPFTITVTP